MAFRKNISPTRRASTTKAGIRTRRKARPRTPLKDHDDELILFSGRKLPPLLFVTNLEALSANIGDSAATIIRNGIEATNHIFLNCPNCIDVKAFATKVSKVLAAHRDIRGVVILGGYDVVRPSRVDAFVGDPLVVNRFLELDRFLVWSDDIYGDADGDGEPELPVSRIPDGKSALLMRQALAAKGCSRNTSFGIRNLKRPFADKVFSILSSKQLAVSEPLTVTDLNPKDLCKGRIYLMLHGSQGQGTSFWGERASGDFVETMSMKSVQNQAADVVFTGCCYGALCAEEMPSGFTGLITARTVTKSLALRFLAAGATAFIGCTGCHYSPAAGEQRYGRPLHVHFCKNLNSRMPPAQALFQAKLKYLAEIPHGGIGSWDASIETKIFRQYTCLGLGW
jgi:hypothetical protein